MSVERDPRNIPVRPPILKLKTNPKANNMAGVSSMEALYSVAIQLKTLMAVGMATKKVRKEKMMEAISDIPEANM